MSLCVWWGGAVCSLISHSNTSWPRKWKKHWWKNSLNNSLSSTYSEPGRTANRTRRGAAGTPTSGSVGELCDCGWDWNKRKDLPSPGSVLNFFSDIVDIKPANMEDLTEVITAAEFHPHHCHLFVYSSSKGTLRLCDMRASALCDRHTKREPVLQIPDDVWYRHSEFPKSFLLSLVSVWRAWRSRQQILLLRNHLLRVGRQVQPQRTLPADQRLPHRQGVGPEHGQGPSGDISGAIAESCCCLWYYSFE